MTITTTMSGSEVVEKVAPPKSPPKEQKEEPDGDSVASPDGVKAKKNWLGKDAKRPRAEYRAEIDELKLKLAALESNLESKTVELNQYKDWMSKAPYLSKIEC